jgi:hypothetical protein
LQGFLSCSPGGTAALKRRFLPPVKEPLYERVPFAFFIKLDPEFDPLRPDARFSDLVLRLGI